MKAEFVSHHSIDFNAWDSLVLASPQGSVFAESWYINTILPEWHAVTVYDEKELQAVMPLYIGQRHLMKYSLQPILAKYWGLIFADKPFKNTYEEYSWKKKVTDAAIAVIPSSLMRVVTYFHPSFDYALPFKQNSFNLDTRYTYRLQLNTHSPFHKGFAEAVSKRVNKARKAGFNVHSEESVEPLMELISQNAKSGKSVLAPSYYAVFRKLAAEGYKRGQAFTKTVFDNENKKIASSIILNDRKCTYFLSGLIEPASRQTGAVPLMVTEILAEAQQRTHEFDFLGSMTEGIESFFRSFGARPVPYLAISKNKFSFLPFR
jgi:hypothetical protein